MLVILLVKIWYSKSFEITSSMITKFYNNFDIKWTKGIKLELFTNKKTTKLWYTKKGRTLIWKYARKWWFIFRKIKNTRLDNKINQLQVNMTINPGLIRSRKFRNSFFCHFSHACRPDSRPVHKKRARFYLVASPWIRLYREKKVIWMKKVHT